MPHANVEGVLDSVEFHNPEKFEALVSLAYGELRMMARSLMRNQKPGHTLQPTALVHEAWLRLAQGEMRFDSRAHFFGAAARAMRQVLVGHARKRNALKRAGAAQRITFSDLAVRAPEPETDLLALDQALTALSARDQRLCRVLELRYFAGLSLEEIGELHGQSLSTVKRDWSYARAWLVEFMSTESAEARA